MARKITSIIFYIISAGCFLIIGFMGFLTSADQDAWVSKVLVEIRWEALIFLSAVALILLVAGASISGVQHCKRDMGILFATVVLVEVFIIVMTVSTILTQPFSAIREFYANINISFNICYLIGLTAISFYCLTSSRKSLTYPEKTF